MLISIFKIVVFILILLFISHLEIKPGFKICLHAWWRGLGILLILIGSIVLLEGEIWKTKKDNYIKGYEEGIEDGFKKGSEKAFDAIRNEINKKESDGKNN